MRLSVIDCAYYASDLLVFVNVLCPSCIFMGLTQLPTLTTPL